MCGALLSLGVAVGAALHDIPSMWWFDGAVALSVAIALGVSGLYTLWKNATHMTYEHVQNVDGNVSDTWTIVQHSHGPFA